MIKTAHDSETPAEGKQVVTTCAFIHEVIDGREKVFLPKRALSKKFLPGVYELPGGHVDFGEAPDKCLMREVKEELDAEISVGDPFYVFSYTNDIKGSHSFEIIYFAKFITPLADIKLNPEDHSEFVWVGEDEIEKIVTKDKGRDDPELVAISKGFEILKGNKLNLG